MNTHPVNAGVAQRFSDILIDLGGIPAARVRTDPKPGTATLEDLISCNENGSLCELVDGTLVEKAMGWQESLIAMLLGEILGTFVRQHDLGLVTGSEGFMRIFESTVRGPDVTFVSWDRLPEGRVPTEAVPMIVPDLAVEVISVSNTLAEMSRKRREYFNAGVRQVWLVDPRERTVAVYTSITKYEILDESQTLSGGDLLPGLQIELARVFGELDRQAPA